MMKERAMMKVPDELLPQTGPSVPKLTNINITIITITRITTIIIHPTLPH